MYFGRGGVVAQVAASTKVLFWLINRNQNDFADTSLSMSIETPTWGAVVSQVAKPPPRVWAEMKSPEWHDYTYVHGMKMPR